MSGHPGSMPPVRGGTLYGVGLGPGEPDYMTLRAAEVIRGAHLVASFARRGGRGHARAIVEGRLRGDQEEVILHYPVTTEIPVEDPAYAATLAAFYDEAAGRLARALEAGRSVALLAEGDPLLYGSFMHLWRRLKDAHPVEIVPGITAMSGAWARAAAPITWGDDVLTVLPGTLDEAALTRRLADTDAAVVMKLGRNLPKVRRALQAAGLLERAIYVERATMAGEAILPLSERGDEDAPYFALILVPGEGRRP